MCDQYDPSIKISPPARWGLEAAEVPVVAIAILPRFVTMTYGIGIGRPYFNFCHNSSDF
jgi:hypothetical protein